MSNNQITLGDVYIEISEPRKLKANNSRQGFDAIKYSKRTYATITIYDNSLGNGKVKTVVINDPAPEYLVKIKDPSMWILNDETVTLITPSGNEVKRTFRIVILRASAGNVIMSNDLPTQIRNFAENVFIPNEEGVIERAVFYVDSNGNTMEIK